MKDWSASQRTRLKIRPTLDVQQFAEGVSGITTKGKNPETGLGVSKQKSESDRGVETEYRE